MNSIVEKQKMLVSILPGIKTQDDRELIKRYIDAAYQAGLIEGRLEVLDTAIAALSNIVER
jgi:hypothetical protein